MKKILIPIAFVLILFGCEKVEDDTFSPAKIKMITEFVFSAIDVNGVPEIEKLLYKDEYKFDINGNVIENLSYNASEKLEDRIIYEYDDKHQIISANQFNNNGTLQWKYKFVYDGNGNNTEFYLYDRNDVLEHRSTALFDNNKNIIELKSYQFYDFLDGRRESLEGRTTFKYDVKNNLIEEKEYNSKDLLITTWTYVYIEFDSEGNWTKRVEYCDNEENSPLIITKREIQYY